MAEASSLFVRIGADTKGLLTGLQAASAAVAKFGAESRAAGATSSTAFRGAQVAAIAFGALAVKGLTSSVHAAEDWAQEVRTLQKTTGLAAEEASGLAFAGDSLGVSVDKLTIGFGLLDKNIVNGTTNFEKYDIATTDAAGNQLAFTTILGNVADKYEELGGGIKGAALAQNVFGRSGRNLIPLLARGSEGIADLVAQASDYGLVIGQDVVDAAREAAIAQRQLGLSVKGLQVQIGVNLIPVFDLFVKGLTAVISILHEIPGPVVDAIAVFAILTGALFAIQLAGGFIARAWAPIIGVFAGSSAATTAQAEASTAAAVSSQALLGAVAELIGPLQALAGIEAEVATNAALAGDALGYQATSTGLLVPETVALGAAEEGAAVGGAGLSAGGVAGLGGLAASGPVVAGIALMAGAIVGLKFSLDAAHRAFEEGVNRDLAILAQGSPRAIDKVRSLANEEKRLAQIASAQRFDPNMPAIGAQFGLLHGGASGGEMAQATEAVKQYDAAQRLAAQGGDVLAESLAKLIRNMGPITDESELSARGLGLLDATIDKLTNTADKLGPEMHDSALQAIADFQKLSASGKATLPELQAAALQMVATVKAAYQDWHDQIVQTFGGAGAALDAFANKSDVDIGRAINHLTQYTAQIGRFGDDLKTVEDEFGKRAADFIEWVTSQGLAQAGLLDAVASANHKTADQFISDFNRAQQATSTLASQIQKALDPVFQRLLLQMKNLVRAFVKGLPPLTVKDQQALGALKDIHGELLGISNKEWLAKVEQAGNVKTALRDIGRSLFGITNKEWKVLVAVTGDPLSTIQAITNGLNNIPEERSVDVYIRTHRVHHEGGLVFHDGGVVPPSPEVVAHAQRRLVFHDGGPVPDAHAQRRWVLHDGGPVPTSPEIVAHAQRMHSGGSTPSGGLGPGEVPAILQTGEFVIRRSAVAKIGVGTLNEMNRMHSGGWVGTPVEEPEMVVATPRVAGSSGSEDTRVRLSLDRRRFGRDLDYELLTD